MAPRSTKAKKTTDVKVADEVPKIKGKGKTISELVIEAKDEDELEENKEAVPVSDKKSKRGGKRKAANTNGQEQSNEKGEEAAPAAKKGKKKVEDSDADEASNDGSDKNGHIEANGDTEQTEKPAGRGRTKAEKKEPAEHKEVKAGRGRKGKQEKTNGDAEKESVDAKPAVKKRGRKAEPKDDAEEAKPEPAAKGRKKVTRVVKEMTPESDKEDEKQEGKITEEPKKKEVKGRKGRGKKAKEEVEEEREENDDEDKGMGDAKAEDDAEEVQEPKPAKGKRAPKKRTATPPADEPQDAQDTGEPKKKKRALSEDTKTAPLKNKSATDFDSLDFSNSSKNKQDKDWNFKIASWNVDGIRAWLNKGGLDYIKYEKPDILCLQETKCAQDKLPDEIANLPGYHAYWLGSEKDGYAGVGIYTTKLAMNVQYGLQDEELDSEGRIITAEYEHFYLICTYVPNAGRNLVTLPKRLKWNEEFRKYVKDLDKKKPVIICGDMNVSHQEIDLANPKTNKKNAGFTVEERTGMTDLLNDGFVDTFRHLYPDKTGAYTFWTYMKNSRSKNVGWRLDYFIVSERLLPLVCDSIMRDQVYGSDHCPISLFLHLSSADKPK